MPVQIKADFSQVRKGITALTDKQLPWTTARALTLCAQGAQAAVRRELPQIFRLRNTWTSQGIRITPATKQVLRAEVRTDTGNRSSGAPDYLPRQDYGGEKIPIGGRQHIAIPTRYLFTMTDPARPIPAFLRPKALLSYADKQGKYTTRQGKERSAPETIEGLVFFLARLKAGDLAIMGRYITDRQAYPMYLLVSEANIKARFPMEQIVVAEVEKNFESHFRRAALETISNDILRGTGIRVKV